MPTSSLRIDQRATGVVLINRGVGLDKAQTWVTVGNLVRPSALTMPMVTVLPNTPNGFANRQHHIGHLCSVLGIAKARRPESRRRQS